MGKANPVSPNIKIMQDAAKLLELRWAATQYRVSRRGVPHVIVDTEYQTFSVCWFGKSQIYRVFFPYPSWGHEVTRADFKTLEDVKRYLVQQTKLAYNNSKLNKVSDGSDEQLPRETRITV